MRLRSPFIPGNFRSSVVVSRNNYEKQRCAGLHTSNKALSEIHQFLQQRTQCLKEYLDRLKTTLVELGQECGEARIMQMISLQWTSCSLDIDWSGMKNTKCLNVVLQLLIFCVNIHHFKL